MSERPLISVVMATYHWPEALACSIPSVIAQTWPEWELLVVGDGCTDTSEAVVAAFAHPRIRWLNRAENSGSQGGPNNLGIAEAKGELIAYLGHDDIWAPDHLERLMACWDGEGDYFASATIAWFDESGGIHRLSGLPLERSPLTHSLLNVAQTPSGILHGRSLWERAGGWADWRDIHLPPDVEFFQRIARLAGPARRNGCVTVAKVASGLRKDSYKRRDVTPQRAVIAALRLNPQFLRDTAFSFLLAQRTDSFRGLLGVLLRLLRRRLGDLGGRALYRAWRRHRLGEGGEVRRLRRFRGLED